MRNHLVALPRHDLETNCEIGWSEVLFGRESLLVCSFYRPPSSDETALYELEDSLRKATQAAANRHILIGSDFNLPSINWNSLSVNTPARDSNLCHRFLDLVQDFYLEQLVMEPTRRTTDTLNILDLLLSTKPGLISNVQIISGLSDHDHIIATIYKHIQPLQQKIRKIYNFRRGNLEGFRSDMVLLAEHFQLSFNHRSANQNWSLFKDTVLSLADKYFPTKPVRPTKSNPWFSRSLRRLTRKKQRLFHHAKSSNSPTAWTAYRKHRKITSQAINHARNIYISNLLDENFHARPK